MPSIKEKIFISYSVVGMAHAALQSKSLPTKYLPIHYGIKNKLFKGLMDGSMKIGSMWDEEKKKLQFPRCCYYCGSEDKLSVDHLIARAKEEIDSSDNLIYACRKCNSSKGSNDLLEFYQKKNEVPPINLLIRYLKICYYYCDSHNLLSKDFSDLNPSDIPFAIELLPVKLPPPNKLKYFIK